MGACCFSAIMLTSLLYDAAPARLYAAVLHRADRDAPSYRALWRRRRSRLARTAARSDFASATAMTGALRAWRDIISSRSKIVERSSIHAGDHIAKGYISPPADSERIPPRACSLHSRW